MSADAAANKRLLSVSAGGHRPVDAEWALISTPAKQGNARSADPMTIVALRGRLLHADAVPGGLVFQAAPDGGDELRQDSLSAPRPNSKAIGDEHDVLERSVAVR